MQNIASPRRRPANAPSSKAHNNGVNTLAVGLLIAGAILHHARHILLFAARLLLSSLQALAAVLQIAYNATEEFRAGVFWHFMVWILNPYAIWLFIFWPGWFVLGTLWMWWHWS